jgi:hypothetical protein
VPGALQNLPGGHEVGQERQHTGLPYLSRRRGMYVTITLIVTMTINHAIIITNVIITIIIVIAIIRATTSSEQKHHAAF